MFSCISVTEILNMSTTEHGRFAATHDWMNEIAGMCRRFNRSGESTRALGSGPGGQWRAEMRAIA